MTVEGIAAISLSGLTLIGLALQWIDSKSRSHRAEIDAAENRGEQREVFKNVRESLIAFHKRQDDFGVAMQKLREVLLAKQILSPHEMPAPSTRSRPPPVPNDVD